MNEFELDWNIEWWEEEGPEIEDWKEYDGQPDDYTENQDFAQDGDFENMEAWEIL